VHSFAVLAYQCSPCWQPASAYLPRKAARMTRAAQFETQLALRGCSPPRSPPSKQTAAWRRAPSGNEISAKAKCFIAPPFKRHHAHERLVELLALPLFSLFLNGCDVDRFGWVGFHVDPRCKNRPVNEHPRNLVPTKQGWRGLWDRLEAGLSAVNSRAAGVANLSGVTQTGNTGSGGLPIRGTDALLKGRDACANRERPGSCRTFSRRLSVVTPGITPRRRRHWATFWGRRSNC
jgi:hypothetical protein